MWPRVDHALIVGRMVKPICLTVTLLAALSGCDSNMTTSDSVVLPASVVTDYWSAGDLPQFVDFNGDGALDVFGWTYNPFEQGSDARIAAFDGVTGQRLWMTPDLEALSATKETRVAFVDGHLVVVNAGGKALAFKPDEKPARSVELGERASRICDGGVGVAVVETRDERAHAISLDTMAVQPGARIEPCTTGASVPSAVIRRLNSWADDMKGDFLRRKEKDQLRIDGMKAEEVLRISTGEQVVLGSKAPGTAVPMIALLRGESVAWTRPIPADEPLRARLPSQRVVTADALGVLVVYEHAGVETIAAFALADGRRTWEAAIPGANIRAMVPVQDRVYVVLDASLAVFDRETGALRHNIGPRR